MATKSQKIQNPRQTKHAGGRPLKFKSVKELQDKIDAYFAYCDPHPEELTAYEYHQKTIVGKDGKEKKVNDRSKPPKVQKYWDVTPQKPYTITSLANFLGTSRETLINYENRDEFFDTIKRAKSRVEEYWESLLIGSNATGPIFNLKNNYGWKDKTEQELTNPDGSLRPRPYEGLSKEQLLEALKRGKSNASPNGA